MSRFDRAVQRFSRLLERRGETSPELLPPPSPNRTKFPFVASLVYQGIPIDLEQRKGDVREGVDQDGTPWRVTMQAHYGEVRSHVRGAAGVMGAKGMDGDRLDVYVGDDPDSDIVVVVDQRIPETGEHDEQKVMLGFPSAAAAVACYRKQYTKPGFYGGHTTTTVDRFRRWISEPKNAGQPVTLRKAMQLPAGALLLPVKHGRWAYFAQLFKGASHKYIKRWPTGKFTKTGRPRYRYYYYAQHGGGVGSHEHMVKGAGFKADGGHWHIEAANGDKLTVKHDETNETRTMTKAELAAKLQAEHKAELDEHAAGQAARVARERAEAKVHGTDAHRKRLGLPTKGEEAAKAKKSAPRSRAASKPPASGKTPNRPPSPPADMAQPEAATTDQPGKPSSPDSMPAEVAEMGIERTKGKRRSANDLAIETAKRALAEGRELTAAERKLVAAYSGEGGIGDSLNQYFTRPDLAQAIWQVIKGLFGGSMPAGAKVLEPACGAGVFMATAPEGIALTGVEIDEDAAVVAKALHGAKHDIRHASFEAYSVSQSGKAPEFDAVIGNAPFVARTGNVQRLHMPHHSNADRYFVESSLEKVKDGGIVSLIVHRNVMADTSPAGRAFREHMLADAELVDSYRLPDTAFAHADTAVVADVLVLRKRPRADAVALHDLRDQGKLSQLADASGDVASRALIEGKFFELHKDRVLGIELSSEQTGWRATVQGHADLIPGKIDRLSQAPTRVGGGLTRASLEAMQTDEQHSLSLRTGIAKALQARAMDAKPPKDGDLRAFGEGPQRGTYAFLNGEWRHVDGQGAAAVVERAGSEAISSAVTLAQDIEEMLKARDGHHLNGRVVDPDYFRARGMRRGIEARLTAWVDKHGNPNDLTALRGLAPAVPAIHHLLAAVTAGGGFSDAIRKDPVFKAPPVERVDKHSLSEVVKHLAHRLREIHVEHVADMWTGAKGMNHEQVRVALLAQPDIMLELNGSLTHREDYATGKVYRKREEVVGAAQAARTRGDRELADRYERQVAALDETIATKRKAIDRVDLDVQSRWIPDDVVSAFLSSEEGQDAWRSTSTEAWAKRFSGLGMTMTGVDVYTEDGVRHARLKGDRQQIEELTSRSAHPMMRYLNGMGCSREQMPEFERVKAIFNDWLRGSEHATRLEQLYNERFFGDIAPRHSDAPLPLKGLATDVSPKAHQNEAARWAVDTGCGIIADGVGVGKTFTGALIAATLKQEGHARKPMIPVPKSLVTNWQREIKKLFPDAKILVIGETEGANGKKRADTAEEREKKLARFVQEDHDFVLITKQALHAIPLRPETIDRMENDPQKWTSFSNVRRKEVEAAGNKKSADSQSKAEARAKAKFEASKAARELKIKRGSMFWEDLGVDALVVDEAHGYKNLESVGSRFGGKPKYLGGSATSKSSMDVLYKAEIIREKAEAAHTQGRVYYLTATPAKNSPLELYNMLVQVAPHEMIQRGISNAEDFVDRYCKIEIKPSLSIRGSRDKAPTAATNEDGEEVIAEESESIEDLTEASADIVEAPCVTGFQHMGELSDLLQRYMLVRSAEDVGLEVPKTSIEEVFVPMSSEQKSIYRDLQSRLRGEQRSPGEEEDPSEMLRTLTDMGQVSQDLHTYGKTVARRDEAENAYSREHGLASPKYQEAAKRIAEGVRTRGGQIVFSDQLLAQDLLRELVIKQGVKPEEIGVINAQVTPDSGSRQAIADRFNRGEIKVVIGNTATMGEGVNLQGREHARGTTDMHHIDLPWDPGSMEQRRGRAVRQGNPATEVRQYAYLSQDSFDGYKAASLSGKKKWLDSLRSGEDEIANEADVSSKIAEFAEMAKYSSDTTKAAEMQALREKVLMQQVAAKALVRDLDRFQALQRDKAAMAKATSKERRLQLEARVKSATAQLRHSEHLPAHVVAALDDKTPVAVASSGAVMRVGKVYEVANGELAVVVGVDPAKKKLRVRAFGGEFSTVAEYGFDQLGKVSVAKESPHAPGDELAVLNTKTPILLSKLRTEATWGRGNKRPSVIKSGIKRAFDAAPPEVAQRFAREAVARDLASKVATGYEAHGLGGILHLLEGSMPALVGGQVKAVKALSLLSAAEAAPVYEAARERVRGETWRPKVMIDDRMASINNAEAAHTQAHAEVVLPWDERLRAALKGASHDHPLKRAASDAFGYNWTYNE